MSATTFPWQARYHFARLHRRAQRRLPFLDRGDTLPALIDQLVRAYALPEAVRDLLTDLVAASPCAASLTSVFRLGTAEGAAAERERAARAEAEARGRQAAGLPIDRIQSGQFSGLVQKYQSRGRDVAQAVEEALAELAARPLFAAGLPAPSTTLPTRQRGGQQTGPLSPLPRTGGRVPPGVPPRPPGARPPATGRAAPLLHTPGRARAASSPVSFACYDAGADRATVALGQATIAPPERSSPAEEEEEENGDDDGEPTEINHALSALLHSHRVGDAGTEPGAVSPSLSGGGR